MSYSKRHTPEEHLEAEVEEAGEAGEVGETTDTQETIIE